MHISSVAVIHLIINDFCIYYHNRPKRYKLSELVDWFYGLMRKDEHWWGYKRYDMRFDPLFMLRTHFSFMISPNEPIGGLHPERLELECITDKIDKSMPTLEDLGVQLTTMEEQAPWELRPYRAALYYDAELNEFTAPPPPKEITPREEARLFA